MDNKYIAAIAVVVVVIIVAAAAVVFMGGDDKFVPPESGDVTSGAIYGNVDGSSHVDQTDIDTIQSVIDGDYTIKDFPLADANVDGVVDEKDIELVKKIMNGESTTVNVVDVNGNIVPVSYPATNYAILGGTNVRTAIGVLHLEKNMLANGTNSYISSVMDKALYEGRENGDITVLSGTSLTVDDVNTLTQLQARLVVSEESGMSSDDAILTQLNKMKITYLELNFKDTTTTMQSIATLGILFQCEDLADKYNTWTQNIMDTIVEKEGDKFGTATVLTVTMSNSVSGTESDYFAASEEVGGKNLADWSDKTRKYTSGTDDWLLDSKYNADYIFHFRSMAYPKEMSESDIAKYSDYFKDTYTYLNGGYYLINGVMPLPVRNAIMAETMYSDCFEEGWAESLLQEYFTEFLGYDYDVTQSEYIWN